MAASRMAFTRTAAVSMTAFLLSNQDYNYKGEIEKYNTNYSTVNII
jgi:hypothetical protein